MPIKPANKLLYPANWKQIRARILERAGHKCEQCGKPNGKQISVLPGGFWYDVERDGWINNQGERVGADYAGPETERLIRVVLTTAHLNHDPQDNRDENLASYCQACHLAHDADLHKEHAAQTRRAKRELFQPRLL